MQRRLPPRRRYARASRELARLEHEAERLLRLAAHVLQRQLLVQDKLLALPASVREQCGHNCKLLLGFPVSIEDAHSQTGCHGELKVLEVDAERTQSDGLYVQRQQLRWKVDLMALPPSAREQCGAACNMLLQSMLSDDDTARETDYTL